MGVWHNARLTKLGGTLQIVVDEPFTFEGDWPSVAWDESTDSPTFTSAHYRAERISTLHVLVYLLEERVVEVDPLDAEISDYTPALP